jgi:hypothetical protein
MNDSNISGKAEQPIGPAERALALVLHALCVQIDAKPVLNALLANYRQELKADDPVFDGLVMAALKSLSSAAVKQHPNDEDVLETYRGLRPGSRH